MNNVDFLDFLKLLDRPIAYHRSFVAIGGVTGGVMLSQAIYWTLRLDEERDGWFFKTQAQWEEETGLTRSEQEGARKKLKRAGILEEKLAGNPATLWYRVNIENLQASLRKTCKQDCGKPANKIAENLQTIYKETETTTETTPEIQALGMVTTTEQVGLPKSKQTFKATRKVKAPFKPGGYSSRQKPHKSPVSASFQAFVDEINQDRRAFHIATTGGDELWNYWLEQGYQPKQISVAARIAYRVDDFWKNNFSPDVFLRQTSKEGVALNNIDKYLNFRSNGDPNIILIKKELGEVQ